MDVSEIFSYFGEIVNDPDSEIFATASRNTYLRDAYLKLWKKTKKINRDYGIRYVDINTSTDFVSIGGGLKAYSPPFELSHIIRIEKTSSDNPQSSIYPISINEKDYYYNQPASFNNTQDNWFYIGRKIAVRDDLSATSARIYYSSPWAELSYGVVQAGGGTTVTLQATPTFGRTIRRNDYYNDSLILIVSGAGNVAGQVREVSDYAAYASPIITVSQAWTTNPALNDVYSFLPMLPEEHHLLIPVMMALIAMKRRGNQQQFDLIKGDYQEDLADFVSTAKERQDQEAREVIDVEDYY